MNRRAALWIAGLGSIAAFSSAAWLAYRTPDPGSQVVSPPQRLSATLSAEEASAASATILALTLPDLDGRPQAFSQWRGKVLVVNYWATWCPPCVKEMPAFSLLHARYRDQGVQFVGIGMDDAGKMREFAKATPVAYPLLVSDSVSQSPGLKVRGLPTTLVIGRDGKIEKVHMGRLDEDMLEPLLQKLSASK